MKTPPLYKVKASPTAFLFFYVQENKSNKNSFHALYLLLLFFAVTFSPLISFSAVYYSRTTGNWNVASTWSTEGCGGAAAASAPGAADDAVICSGNTVTMTADETITNLNVNGGGTLNDGGRRPIITGNLTVDGTVNGTAGSSRWTLSGTGVAISGTGTFNLGDRFEISNNKSISASANLTLTGMAGAVRDCRVLSGTVTNNGVVVLSNLDLTSAGTWTNAASASFSTSGAILITTFNASTSGNTVTYNLAGAQNVVVPSDGAYNNLSISSSGTKTCLGALTINGNLSIAGTAALDVSLSNYAITVKGNWSNTSANADPFVQQSGTVTFGGTAAQSITASPAGGETFYNCTMNNSSSNLTLSSPITVTNVLTLTNKNIITTSANLLSMAAGSSVSPAGGSASSFVDGPISKAGTTAFVFPTGNGTRWARIGIGAPSASTTFQAQYTASAYSNTTDMAVSPLPVLTNVSTMEYWQLDRTVGAGDATVTLYWEDADFSGITVCDPSDLRVAHWSGSAWENNNESVTTTGSCGGAFAGSVSTAAVVTSFSPFTFGSKGANALPIELLYFGAALTAQEAVKVFWSTASETNNDYFTIERAAPSASASSGGALNWEAEGTVNGAGNSFTQKNYEFIDNTPLSFGEQQGVRYYRLKQTDFDGRYSYSQMVAVEMNVPSSSILLYPNPALTAETVHMDVPYSLRGKEVLVVVWDVMGNEAYSKVIITGADQKRVTAIDPSATLAKGIYLITASSLNRIYKQKLVIE